jgi:ribosomal protein S1
MRLSNTVVILALCTEAALAADLPGGTDPSKGEPPPGDSVKGTLLKIEGGYFVIEGHDGEQVRVHVDESTKLDRVLVGDKVKAYITRKGHVTALERAEK